MCHLHSSVGEEAKEQHGGDKLFLGLCFCLGSREPREKSAFLLRMRELRA